MPPDDATNLPSTALAPASRPMPLAPLNLLNDPAAFAHMLKVAETFANSELVPPHLRRKPADCLIALDIANRMNESPIMVMQNIYIVSGKAGWSAQYMIARANRSGVFSDRISWHTQGAGAAMVVTAFATLAGTGQKIDATVSMAMAQAEGWTKNPKYRTMPEHMLRYRSATMLIRLYAPDVMMGLPTADENEDVAYSRGSMRDVTETAPAARRPTRQDFKTPETAQAEPEGYDIVNEVGEVVATHATPDEWARALFRAAQDVHVGKQYLTNNIEAARALFKQIADEKMRADLGSLYAPPTSASAGGGSATNSTGGGQDESAGPGPQDGAQQSEATSPAPTAPAAGPAAPDWNAYVANMPNRLAEIATADALTSFETAERAWQATHRTPKGIAAAVGIHIANRRKALAGGVAA